jgi:predicted phosphodiesterase
MKAVKVNLSKDIEQAQIHVFSDWHVGDKGCKINDIQQQITEVANNPNAYCILNGDLMNNATKTSVSDCYAEVLTPMEQLSELYRLLSPIKDKILLITIGNHEARTYRQDGIDLMRLLARQLDIEDRYCSEGGVLFLRLGKGAERHAEKPYSYTLYVTHGSGGGRKEGAKAVRLADMASIIDVDIYVHSHTHLPMIMKQSFYRVSQQNSSVAKAEKLFVNTAAQLEYGGYGQTYEFKPNSTANPIIYLSGKKKDFSARL